MNSKNNDYFTVGNSLSNSTPNKSADKAASVNAKGKCSHICTVCGTQNRTPLCEKCGFDNSRNYELYPTLQVIKSRTPAVSLFKILWNPPPEPSVEQTLALIKNQQWDDNVLSAVEKILSSAKSGRFDKQQFINISGSFNERQHTEPKEPAYDKRPKAPSRPNPYVKTARICSVCNTNNSPNSQYCCNCGAKLNTYSANKNKKTAR